MRTNQDYAQEVKERGYVVVPEVLDGSQITATIEALEQVFHHEREIGKTRGWHNDLYKVAYMLPQKHALFREFPLNPRLLPLMRVALGADCLMSSLNGLTMTPGGDNQKLHRDAPFTPNNVLTINALHCLDPFTRENGATRLIPFSQDRPIDPKTSVEELEKQAIFVEAPAGSLIAYNGGLMHAGSANASGRPRRAIHAFFCRAWVKPQWDYTRSLSQDIIAQMTPDQRSLFAVDHHIPYYDPATDAIIRRNKPEFSHQPSRA